MLKSGIEVISNDKIAAECPTPRGILPHGHYPLKMNILE